MPASRPFSAREVDALVPKLEALFSRLDALQSEIGARSNELQRLGYGTPAPDEPPEVLDRRRILAERRQALESALGEFEALGGLLMDLELGVVAFPAQRNGQAVYLSWQRGDAAVQYFHRPEDHFLHGRQRL